MTLTLGSLAGKERKVRLGLGIILLLHVQKRDWGGSRGNSTNPKPAQINQVYRLGSILTSSVFQCFFQYFPESSGFSKGNNEKCRKFGKILEKIKKQSSLRSKPLVLNAIHEKIKLRFHFCIALGVPLFLSGDTDVDE